MTFIIFAVNEDEGEENIRCYKNGEGKKHISK